MKTEIIIKAVVETNDEGASLRITGEVTPNNIALSKLPPDVMVHVTTGMVQAAEHLADTYAKVHLLGHLHELFDNEKESESMPQEADGDSLHDKHRTRFSLN